MPFTIMMREPGRRVYRGPRRRPDHRA